MEIWFPSDTVSFGVIAGIWHSWWQIYRNLTGMFFATQVVGMKIIFIYLMSNGDPVNRVGYVHWMVRSIRLPVKVTGIIVAGSLLLLSTLSLPACSTDSSTSSSYYVDGAAKEGGDGTSWNTAFNHPQDALDVAVRGDEIWVAQGVYGPLDSTGREVVHLKPGVTLLGGFEGSEADSDQRNPSLAETVLDGLGRSYHVVIGADSAVLDGFTVTGGSATGNVPQSKNGGTYSGGGMFNSGVAPEVRNCLFIRNTASFNGGAMFNENSDPLIVDCVFDENTATFGGAMDNRGSSPTVVNAKFQNNNASVSGGAVTTFQGAPVFINTVFSGNRSGQVGGAVLSNGSDSNFVNCSIVENKTGQHGAGVSTWEGQVNLTNCILWNDLSGDGIEISTEGGAVKVLYSIVQGGYEGTGNLDEYPEFDQVGWWAQDGSWVNGDYHLKGVSPAVDSGTDSNAPDFDVEYNSRPQALAHDMGAFERLIQ